MLDAFVAAGGTFIDTADIYGQGASEEVPGRWLKARGNRDDLVRDGKVRYLGASSMTPSQLQKALDVARFHGWEPFVCPQPLYNLLARELKWELLPLSEAEGVGVIPFSPPQGALASHPPLLGRVSKVFPERSSGRSATVRPWRTSCWLQVRGSDRGRGTTWCRTCVRPATASTR
ncbi:aldo/keto reductase [Streptomyces sp. NRRL WC-3773]|uniref:aldo/keto reductase n=1 Tax=Streptomyces chrestomyceticus TaxID=68185 RepID=UPI0004C8A5EF